MQNLQTRPITDMFQSLNFTFVKEAGLQKESQRYMEVVQENPEAYPLLTQVMNGTLNARNIPPEQQQAFALERNQANNESKSRNFNPDTAFGGAGAAPPPAADADGDGIPDTNTPQIPAQSTVTTTGTGTSTYRNVPGGANTLPVGDEESVQGQQVTPTAQEKQTPDAPPPDMMSQIQGLVDQRDQINLKIKSIQDMFGFGNQQGQATSQVAPQATPQATPGANKGWGAGIGDFARNMWNMPGNIQRGWQGAAPQAATAYSNRIVLTAAMGSPSKMFLK